ncbi:MAG: hypothetical protein ABH881_00660 [bacterium]
MAAKVKIQVLDDDKTLIQKKSSSKKITKKKRVRAGTLEGVGKKIVKKKAVVNKKIVPKVIKKVQPGKRIEEAKEAVEKIIEESGNGALSVNIADTSDAVEVENIQEKKIVVNPVVKIAPKIKESRNFKAQNFAFSQTETKDATTSLGARRTEDKKMFDDNNKEKKNYFPRSIGLYRKIAFSFVALTVILVAAIVYFSVIRVYITIVPNQETIIHNMIFDVYDKDNSDIVGTEAVLGIVKEANVSYTDKYNASGVEVVGKEAVGKVKIINNSTSNQPLVATTRLVPVGQPDKLYRIKNTINVPAGGFIEVDIYADEPSTEMAIGPTKFTIPGLWAGLQDKIYAESQEAIVYREKVKKYIVQADIDESINDLKQKLLINSKDSADFDKEDYDQIIYKINEDSISVKIGAKAGEEKEGFEGNITAKVTIIIFDGSGVVELAKEKFISALGQNEELLNFNESDVIYTLSSYNVSTGFATLSGVFEGKTTLNADNNIVDKEKIVGLNKEQLQAYLSGIPQIAGYEIKFYPSFIKKIPKFIEKGKIIIEVKK